MPHSSDKPPFEGDIIHPKVTNPIPEDPLSSAKNAARGLQWVVASLGLGKYRHTSEFNLRPSIETRRLRGRSAAWGMFCVMGVVVYAAYEHMSDGGRPIAQKPSVSPHPSNTPHAPLQSSPAFSNCTADNNQPGLRVNFTRIADEHHGIVTFGMLPDAIYEQYHIRYDDYAKIVNMNRGVLETRHHGHDEPTADTRSGATDWQCLAMPADHS